jgi:hypothetical protein
MAEVTTRDVHSCSLVVCWAQRVAFVALHMRQQNSITLTRTGRGGLQGCEMLRIPHCLDRRLTDGGKVVSLRTGRALLHRSIIIFLLLVLTCVRG